MECWFSFLSLNFNYPYVMHNLTYIILANADQVLSSFSSFTMLREVAVYEKVFCLVWSWQKCFPLLCLYHTRLGCLCAIVRWWEELHCVVVRRKPLLSMRGKHCEAHSRFRGDVKARLSEISGQYLFSSPIEKLFAPILWMMTMTTMTTVRWPQ